MRRSLSFVTLTTAFLLAWCCVPTPAAALPDSFSVNVNTGGATVELNLTKHSLRSSDYLVRSWTASSPYLVEHSQASQTLEVRTYRGYVTEHPNELVVAVVLPGNLMDAEGHIGKGRVWSVSSIDVSSALAEGSTKPSGGKTSSTSGGAADPVEETSFTCASCAQAEDDYADASTGKGGDVRTLGTLPVQDYMSPSRIYSVHGVFDITSRYYDDQGQGNLERAVARVEHTYNVHDFFNTRDAMINFLLTEVMVRKEQFYADTAASTLRAEWLARGVNTRGFIASFFPYGWSYAGGFASGNNFYNTGGEPVCVNAFYHENAHNWRASHYLYGRDTMGGNRPLHEAMNVQKVLYTRQLEINAGDLNIIVTNYPTALHPHTTLDLATTPVNTPVAINVLANDWDANGNALSVRSHTVTTLKGGTVTEAGGVLTYTPATGYVGKDVVVCEIEDATGLYTVEPVHIEVVNGGLVASWSFEEAGGQTAADGSGNGHAGTLIGSTFGTDSVPGVVGNAIRLLGNEGMLCDGSDLINDGAYDLTENNWPLEDPRTSNFFDPMDESFSVAFWFNPSDTTERTTLLDKSNKSGIGWEVYFAAGGNIEARVRRWEGLGSNKTVSTGISVQPGTWYHVAMVINRNNHSVRMHINGIEYGTPVILESDAWIFEGWTDTYLGTDYWNGGPGAPILFDEVGIYSKALSPAEILALVSAGTVPAGAPNPADGSFNEPLDTTLSWLGGGPTYVHDVYIGTDAAAVAAATSGSPEYRGRQSSTTYDPGPLHTSRNYYWRIDEVEGGVVVVPGQVWKFGTVYSTLLNHLRVHLPLDDHQVQVADGNPHTADDVFAPAQDFDQLVGVTPGVAGRIGQAVTLNGTDGRLHYGSAWPVAPGSVGMTYAFWINTISADSSAHVYNFEGAHFLVYNNGDLKPIMDGSSSGAQTFNVNINNGQWRHVALVHNGTSQTRLYVDGSLAGTQTESLHPLQLGRTVSIGAHWDSTGDHLAAAFDDFSVWTRALSAGEIQTIHTAGLASQPFTDQPLLVNTSFESTQGFSGYPSGSHGPMTTETDNLGNVWSNVSDTRIWNRIDIPPDGVQEIMLGNGATDSSAQAAIPGADHGIGSVSFDYAAFSSYTDADLYFYYNANDGSGWIEAWSTHLDGMIPSWEDKPWPSVELGLNIPGNVDLKWRTVGTKGCMLDNVYVTGFNDEVLDTDGDGLPDDWEFYWFGHSTAADPGDDSEAPGSLDRILNGEEYILDFNPLASNAPFRVQSIVAPGNVLVTFGQTTDTRLYTVEYSTNLADGTAWIPLEPAAPGSNGVTTVNDPANDNKRPYRVNVTVP